MKEEKESREELRARLRRRLAECGIDADMEDCKQLRNEARLIDACERRKEQIREAKAAVERLKPTKTSLAEDAGLSRLSISESHNSKLNRIYDSYFPQEEDETVPKQKYHALEVENEHLKKQIEAAKLTDSKYILAKEENNKLRNKIELNQHSIANLHKMNDKYKELFKEVTGKEVIISADDLIDEDELNRDENPGDFIQIHVTGSNKYKN